MGFIHWPELCEVSGPVLTTTTRATRGDDEITGFIDDELAILSTFGWITDEVNFTLSETLTITLTVVLPANTTDGEGNPIPAGRRERLVDIRDTIDVTTDKCSHGVLKLFHRFTLLGLQEEASSSASAIGFFVPKAEDIKIRPRINATGDTSIKPLPCHGRLESITITWPASGLPVIETR